MQIAQARHICRATFHPATLDSYILTVDRLASVLADHAEAGDDREAVVASFRALVDSVTVHPKPPREASPNGPV